MKRKLVKQGVATLMISLPTDWLRQHKLEKGNDIELQPSGDALLIKPDYQNLKRSIKITLEGDEESMIRTVITNAYRRGYDLIEINYSNKKQFEILSSVIKTRLVGFEVIKNANGFCVIENVTEPAYEQFDNIFSKECMSILELFDLTTEYLEGKKISKEDYEEVEERIQKYDNFCRRALEKHPLSTNEREYLVSFLSHIIHGQRELYHLLRSGIKISKNIHMISVLRKCKTIFELVIKAYKDKSIGLVKNVHTTEREIIYDAGYKILKNTKQNEGIAIYHLMSSARQFYLANSPLIALLL
ncbi:MAG TPA: AbrB/MazE/SpoVT family DNA-binding domain-containing protein [Candidatus Nanoarchaeia archaeon]|nr:AbrB/MazE/SpoVT family DNA-binding domain-containing protein [Candidatus Nanoarchaeia archaeon]